MLDAILKCAGVMHSMAIPAERVATIVESCLTRRRAPTRVLVGLDAKILSVCHGWISDRWLDALLGLALRIPWRPSPSSRLDK
jgi:hypothetical protein